MRADVRTASKTGKHSTAKFRLICIPLHYDIVQEACTTVVKYYARHSPPSVPPGPAAIGTNEKFTIKTKKKIEKKTAARARRVDVVRA